MPQDVDSSRPVDSSGDGAPDIEITSQMSLAGEKVLAELVEVREPAYVVKQVYRAMAALQSRRFPT